MQNKPRIYLNNTIRINDRIVVHKEVVHYLRHVMRRADCLVFNNGIEFEAILSDDNNFLNICSQTDHADPSNNITLYFAPIKRLDEMLNMVTQLGVEKLQPVITDRTTVNHINWERMQKIIIEASEQSNRNSVPVLCSPIKFKDLDLHDLIYADERYAHGKNEQINNYKSYNKILIGPEGGFSLEEFAKLDTAKNVCAISLGKTVLRAEVAAVVAISKVL